MTQQYEAVNVPAYGNNYASQQNDQQGGYNYTMQTTAQPQVAQQQSSQNSQYVQSNQQGSYQGQGQGQNYGQGQNVGQRQANGRRQLQLIDGQVQINKLPTQTGQPLEGLNQVVYRGWFAGATASTANNGIRRQSFQMVIPVPKVQNGQILVDANGFIQTRDTLWRCQAWGDVAISLEQVQEGTPIEVVGPNHRFSFTGRQSNETVWMQEAKIFSWKYI